MEALVFLFTCSNEWKYSPICGNDIFSINMKFGYFDDIFTFVLKHNCIVCFE